MIVVSDTSPLNLLMDDNPARKHAEQDGLRVTGTLGVLRDAAGNGLIDLRRAFEGLKQTNFRVPPTLFDRILEGK